MRGPSGGDVAPSHLTVAVREETVETCMGVDVAYAVVVVGRGAERMLGVYSTEAEAQEAAAQVTADDLR